MQDNMYFWVKAFHLISVISWMAGMLYLPRLYVYHADAEPGGELSETLKIMERRLLRFIINPAMISTWIFGIWLATFLGMDYLKSAGWFHAKVTLLVFMQICHAMLARYRRQFAEDRNIHSARFYRILNEFPTLLMILIVLLAVIKPF